jgi:hypothetical protein
MSYRSPAMTGDLTMLDGEVVEVGHDDPSGQPVAKIHVVMSNQNEAVLAEGDALVRLPTEVLPGPEPR